MYKYWIAVGCLSLTLVACSGNYLTDNKAEASNIATKSSAKMDPWEMDMSEKIQLSEEEWRQKLTKEQFHILREKGTERGGTGEYEHTKTPGIFHCAGCGFPLFSSDTKYDSGSGWPSFWEPIKDGHVAEKPDNSLFMKRTEVLCERCGGHLGHVFNDGPQPTGLRYCINSASLKLVEGDTELKASDDE